MRHRDRDERFHRITGSEWGEFLGTDLQAAFDDRR
jgi:hypothetical protein